ncbi:ribosomal-protein-alanine N-acetyltransferase [Planomicrobium koreense]|uniref:Ribosomal-protein-alanine N-acetyltransferase n=1 Tax=Planococcus koreensis TaxID=112331 RepID=A0A7W8CVD5_9BACL|nr:GNAT family protein [Planococcus koreensis]MBB5180962.1 ribosomal-protein-alanine N-acetyltransferase [Planococcus koreensis]
MLQEVDAQDLFDFEIKNRGFFERMVPSRGDDYYIWESFIKRHQALLKEQVSGLSHFYLIKDTEGKIVGRINLVDINQTTGTAELGFRVGEAFVGKGIGNKALRMLLNTDLDITQITAKTTTVNKASQKVLQNNGFVQTAIGEEEFEMNGQKMKFVHYLWEKENSTPKKNKTST